LRSDDLIISARILIDSSRASPGQPRQANNRRAVSTAYYAVFHELCSQIADTFVGGTGADRSEKAWQQAYRAVDHGSAAQRCKEAKAQGHGFPAGIVSYAKEFAVLQEERHKADYAPTYRINVRDAEAFILRAEDAISGLRACQVKGRRAFCVWIAFKRR